MKIKLIGGSFSGRRVESDLKPGDLLHVTDHWTPLIGPAVYKVARGGKAVNLTGITSNRAAHQVVRKEDLL